MNRHGLYEAQRGHDGPIIMSIVKFRNIHDGTIREVSPSRNGRTFMSMPHNTGKNDESCPRNCKICSKNGLNGGFKVAVPLMSKNSFEFFIPSSGSKVHS